MATLSTLSTLPPELLLVISSHLDYENEVNALAQVSRNLYCTLDPVLYQINARDGRSHALEWAAINGAENTALKALEAGSQLTAETLCLAITHAQENMAQLLLEKGASPDEWTDYNELLITPFGTAILKGYETTVRMLIDYGATSNLPWDGCHRTPLALAAEAGHLSIVQLLAEAGCDVDYPNSHGDTLKDTPLILAAKNGHTSIVQFLLECGADPNRKGQSFTSPLYAALNHIDTVRCLLRSGACPTFDTLCNAFGGNCAGTVEVLLDYLQQPKSSHEAHPESAWASTTEPTLDTNTLISICSAWNLVPQLKILLTTQSMPSNLDIPVTPFLIGRNYLATPLTLAAERGHLTAVRLLLGHGADPNGVPIYTKALVETIRRRQISGEIKRPLTAAIRTGNQALVQALLLHGADPTLHDRREHPGLFQCLSHERKGEGIFNLLLEAGAAYRVSDAYGNPLWSAVIQHGTATELKLLLERGIDIPLHLFQTMAPLDEDGKFEEDWDESSNKTTLLYLLAKSKDTEAILSTLVEIGLNPFPSVSVYQQQTCHALFTAVIHSNLALLRFLLQRGFAPKPCFPWSAALLRAAADNRNKALAEEMVDLVLSTGVEVDMLNCWGGTPLLLSLCRQRDWQDRHSVEVLLTRGSDPLFLTAEGECPLTVAARYGNHHACRLLLEKIDAQGIPFEYFEGQLSRAVEVALGLESERNDTLKMLRREYWRRRYPVAVA